jgi:hypothetical protein
MDSNNSDTSESTNDSEDQTTTKSIDPINDDVIDAPEL